VRGELEAPCVGAGVGVGGDANGPLHVNRRLRWTGSAVAERLEAVRAEDGGAAATGEGGDAQWAAVRRLNRRIVVAR
jgi:hypothetical protein